MAGLHWYAHYLDDYRRDTGHLSMIEDGAYRRLLDELYTQSKPLPPNVMAVYRLARASTEDERVAVDSVLSQFFQSTPEGFVQKRAMSEIARLRAARRGTSSWKDRPRRKISDWAKTRLRVFARYDYTCVYCGTRDVELHCDHVWPHSRGGDDSDDNLVTACEPCNLSKGARSPIEWFSARRRAK